MRDRTEDQIKIVMIRHGATLSNARKCYLGRTDESLSAEGILELKECREKKLYPETDILFCGPMKRCRETADILYPDKSPILIPEWTEMDFGAFEGKNYSELKDDKRYQDWIDSNGILPFPDGESREDFIRRSCAGMDRMIDVLRQKAKIDKLYHSMERTIGIVVHGGTIMALLHRYHGGEYFSYQVSNGRGYVSAWESLYLEPVVADIERLG